MLKLVELLTLNPFLVWIKIVALFCTKMDADKDVFRQLMKLLCFVYVFLGISICYSKFSTR